jgi:hypothetical protein
MARALTFEMLFNESRHEDQESQSLGRIGKGPMKARWLGSSSYPCPVC